jgi:hypothetical protein
MSREIERGIRRLLSKSAGREQAGGENNDFSENADLQGPSSLRFGERGKTILESAGFSI